MVCAALCVLKSISFIRPRSCDVSASHAAGCLLAPWQARSRPAVCRVISHYSIHHSTSILAPIVIGPYKVNQCPRSTHPLQTTRKRQHHVFTSKLLPIGSSQRHCARHSLRTCLLLHRLRTSVWPNMAESNER